MSKWSHVNTEMVEVKGLDELEAKLNELGDRQAYNAIRSALNAASQILVSAATNNIRAMFSSNRKHFVRKLNASVSPGNLLRGIIKRAGKTVRNAAGGIALFYGRPPDHPAASEAFFGRYLEKGFKVGEGRRRKGRKVKYMLRSRVHMVAGRPFLEPAFKSSQRAMLDKIQEVLWKRIESWAAKGGK